MADVGVDEVCSKQSQHLQFWFAPSAVTLGVVLVLNSFLWLMLSRFMLCSRIYNSSTDGMMG